jgi:hypothetical protein
MASRRKNATGRTFIKPSPAKRLTLPIVIGGVALMILKILLLMRFRAPQKGSLLKK